MSGSNLTTLRLSAILLAPTLLAQQSPTTTTLHGTVLNAVTHQPIARALVSLDQSTQATLTDNEGHFTFDNIPAGQTTLTAKRPGYASDDSGATTHEPVTVPNDADLTLQLIPLSSITGELILPNDDASDSLQVQLLHQEIQNGRGHWAIYRNAEATSVGRFRFGNLPAGAYLVHVAASLDPAPARSNHTRSGYVPAFYPGVRDIAGAGIIRLTPGQQADVKMELTREPYYPIAIPVANFEEARGIGFEVSSDSFLGLPARFSPQDGMAHIDLPAGHYLLQAQGFGQRAVAGEKEFDVNPDSGSVPGRAALTLLPSNRIPVTVHTDFTHPQAGGVPNTANQINLTLQRDGNGPQTHGRTPTLQDDATSAATGVSALVGVSPGKYWVNARPFNGYVAAMTSGGVDLLEIPLLVAPDGSASPIEVTLRDDYATLSVTLGSSAQASPSPLYIHLIPTSGPAVGNSETAFPAQPTMSINNVLPGSYLVFASTSKQQIEYRNPTILATIGGKAQALTIEPGGATSITLDSFTDSLTEARGGAF